MNDTSYIGQELHIFANAINWKRYFAAKLRPHLGKRVLEVGAGLGATTAILCDGTQEAWTCLEPDARLAARIVALITAGGLPACCRAVTGVVADLEPVPSYDCIVYIDVLEHIQDDKAELAQAAVRLLPGGFLVVLSPAFSWLFSSFDASIGHFRRYDKKSLGELTPAGCVQERMFYLDSVGVLISVANRILLRQGLPTDGQIQFWDRNLIPLSRLLDPILNYSLGRSIIGIWTKGR